jgi:5-formyltetrahydrofolate cyclo-ligase
MSFYYASSLEELKAGMFNIPEPMGGEIYRPQNGDVCIVPGLAYDKYGFRLGYGRGFYDRFLSGFSGVTVGLCYSSFIDSCLPRGKYDVKTDVVLTEKGVFPLQKIK